MAKYLPLPDGSSLKVPDSMSYEEAMSKAQGKFPELFAPTQAPPKTGLMADVMGAGSSLWSTGRTGLAALTGNATEAAEAGSAREKKLQEQYKSGLDLDKITDKFGRGEYLGAAGEAISQVPSAVASLLPSTAQSFGLAAAGRGIGGALGALTPIPGGAAIGSQIGQYGLPFLVGAIQALGGQAQEKAQTQIAAGEKPDVNALELAPFAIGHAALDLISNKIAMPSMFKKAIGVKLTEEAGDAAAVAVRTALIADARKVAGRGTLETIGRGMGGFALGEMPTEVLQDVVDRAAVGKSLTDDDAFKAYRNTALTMVLASPLGGAGGIHQRSGARDTVASLDKAAQLKVQVDERRAAGEVAAQATAAKQTPEYALKVADDYAAAEKNKNDLRAQIRKVPEGSPKGTTLSSIDKAFNATLFQQLKEQAPALKALSEEANRLAPAIEQATEQRRVAGMTPEDYMLEQTSQQEGVAPRSREERLAALNQPIAKDEAAPAAAPEVDYVQERMETAKLHNELTVDTKDYVNYLMTDQRMAKAIVDNQTELPGLPSKQQNAIRGALKLQLKDIERKRVAAGQAGTTASQMRIGTLEEEEQANTQAQRDADAADATRMGTERSDTERKIRIAPEVAGIQRLGKPAEGSQTSARADELFRNLYQKQMDEQQVDKLIATLPLSSISRPGRIYAGMGFETDSRRDLLTRISVAKMLGGVEDGTYTELQQKLDDLNSKPLVYKSPEERLPGEGTLPEAEKKTVEAERLADKQSQTLGGFVRFLEKNKPEKGRVTLKLGQTPVNKAGAAKKAVAISRGFKTADQMTSEDWVGALGAVEGAARENDVNEPLSLDDAILVRKMVAKNIVDGVKKGKTREQIVSQLEGLTRGGLRNTAMANIHSILDISLDESAGTGATASVPVNKAGAGFKNDFTKQHLAEIAARLDAFGLPPLTEMEQTRVTAKVMGIMDQLESRWGQSRVGAPAGQRAFGAPIAALEVIQESLRMGLYDIVNTAAERFNLSHQSDAGQKTNPPTGGARIAVPDELKLRGESTAPKDDLRVATEAAKKLLVNIDQRTRAAPAEGRSQHAQDLQAATDRVQELRDEVDALRSDTRSKVPAPVLDAKVSVASLSDLRSAMDRLEKLRNPENESDIQQQVSLLRELRNATEKLQDLRSTKDTDSNRATPLSEDTKDFVRTADELLPTITDPALVTNIKEELQGITEGRLPRQQIMQDLRDYAAEHAKAGESTTRPGATQKDVQRTSAEPQIGLPGIEAPGTVTQRATPANFQKMLDSKDVQGLRDALEKMRIDNAAAIVEAAQNTPAALRAARITKARLAHDVALNSVQQSAPLVRTFHKVLKEELAGAEEVVDTLEGRVGDLEGRLREIASVKATLASGTTTLTLEKGQSKGRKKGRTLEEMDFIQHAAPILSQEKALTKQLAEATKVLGFARDLHTAVKAAQAKETAAFEGVIAKAKQDEKDVTTTRNERDLAEREEREAEATKRELEDGTTEKRERKETAQRAREGLDLPGLRVTADTTKMDARTRGLRKAIGSLDTQIDAQKDPVKKEKLQAQLAVAEKQLASVYADAPRVTTELKERGQVAFDKAFDDAQAAPYDNLSLAPRKHGGLDRAAVGSRVIQTGEKRATPATIAAMDAMDRVAQERTELAKLEAQVTYLKTNKKVVPKALTAKTAAQTKAVKAVEKEQKGLAAEVVHVSAESSKLAAKGQSEGQLYRTSTRGGATLATEEVARIVDRITATWKNAPEIVIVATEKELPLRILGPLVMKEVEKSTPGLFDIKTGVVYLIASNLHNENDVVLTVAHEAAGHFGLRDMLGGDYTRMMDSLYAGNPAVKKQADAKMLADPALPKQFAVEEVLASMAETGGVTPAEKGALRRIYDALRFWFRKQLGLPNVTDAEIQQVVAAARKHVVEGGTAAEGKAPEGEALRRTGKTTSEFDAAREPSAMSYIWSNFTGLAGRMQYIDKSAALSRGFKEGANAGVISDTEAGNAEFLLRFGEHTSQYAGQVLTTGPLTLVTEKTADGAVHTYKSTKGPNALEMAEALSKGGFASDTEAEGMLTTYVSGARANQVGWEKLNYAEPAAEKAKYGRLLDILKADPKKKAALEEAADIFQKINHGQLDFLVQTGEMSAAKAAELKAITYIPFYRVNAHGEVQLMIDSEHAVRIGNIKDQPELKQLVGDNKQIMPIFSSMVQNTFMLTRMGLRNQTIKETAFTLRKVGIASRIGDGPGPARPDIVRFKRHGLDMHVVIDTDMYGIPAKYIVEGMEGIKTTIPAVVKLLGIPADLLRKFVTRAPPYAIRQVIRDPLNAWLTTGTDAFPVLSSFKELASMVAGRSDTERLLMESGAVSSNVFTGDERDMSKLLREITSGKAGWSKLLAKADAFALQGDTATRAVIYKDSIAKGMSHQQALLRAVESMNFSRRGLSPSIQMLSTMIPFFNAQIQGLDVLYRAFKGDMTHNEQLQIREKLFKRGLMLAIGTMAYAAAMQDDEAYKRAKPEERYGNWFVYLPGVSEPVRVPIPFELGYLFKALPEAIINMVYGDEKVSSVAKGMGKLLGQSNPFALPQAVKPLTEVVLGTSFFGGAIESEREKQTMAKDRYRESSTEVAKLLGSVAGSVGLSPVKIDHLIRGYTGGLGIALVQLANPLLNTEAEAGVAKPTTKPSKLPFIGGLFQPIEGRGTLDAAYDKMLEIQQVKGSYNALVEKGKHVEAQAFVQHYANQLALVSTSGSVNKELGEMSKQERIIRAHPKRTTEQKDTALEQLDKRKLAYARQFLNLADKTRPQ